MLRSLGSCVQQTSGRTLALPLTSCVNLGLLYRIDAFKAIEYG